VALSDYGGEMIGFGWAELSAHRTLARLHDRIGGPGLAATVTVPGLSAEVDQHAAAVRDILAVGVEGPAAAAVLLAGYARGLLDQAKDMGWRFGEPAKPAGWATVDWLTARLLAICDLARRADGPDLAGIEF
jgi:hypothetical protein